jgi:hypothetical protein
LLALTIQADVLKKLAIQANASAWIGLIVDNYGSEYNAEPRTFKISLNNLECKAKMNMDAVAAAQKALKEYESVVEWLIREISPSAVKPSNCDSKEAVKAADDAEKALKTLRDAERNARKVMKEYAR